ncbi:cytochrome c oxidase assembly protein [Arthrobacter sp. ISL-69]|uniref:cytochrome c oxidase assembly protein n=1 Tax=Arthrobacter sp. ISL-69 TaxID=2819113 RepID=UPI001BE9B69E|nr:cytochrome c oxidase assembly protein [Arthrobacter sp. ISL-69]MBT2538600.1 bifunctional copper resistance protein CopD/cytochrome c oxidase assembly protein [Arthrobacter sp. ISL-69]
MPSAAKSRPTLPQPSPTPGKTGAAGGAAGISRPWQFAGVAGLFLGLAAALLFSGAAAAREVSDPGALIRWGLPISKAVHNVSLATVIGGLIFAVGILPRNANGSRSKDTSTPEHPAFSRALAVAAAAGAAWTLSAIAVLVLTYSDVAGQSLSGDAEFTRALVYFMTDIETGRAWLAVTIVAAVVTTALFGVRSLTGLAITLVLSLVGMVPIALIGHSSSSSDHEGAINSLALHLVGVSAWVGGIIMLAVLSGILTGGNTNAGAKADITEPTLRRFSSLAGFAFVLVFASGVINASIRITSWHDLFGSAYGQMVLAKAVATLMLGGIGLMHRQWVIPQLHRKGAALSARRVLWQLVIAELLIMGATSGIAVALGRSAPPQPTTFAPDASPAFILSGYELPPELTPERWLTEWRLDWLWIGVAVFGLVSYVLGVAKVRRRGDKWSWFRTVNWVIGLLVLTYITSGPPSVYGRVLFSAHMVDHMALTMVAPIFLVLGAPVTLALRALPARGDGSRGIREWLLLFVHSKLSQLVTHPLFAAANFAGSIVLFYYSDAFGYAMRDHVGHELMNLHFALTGYIFVLSMIGTDPLPRRAPYPMRLLLLLATMGFHAFFGVAIMGGTGLLAADYFGNLGRAWGPNALLDQQMGGALAWGIGEVPTLLVAIGVAVMWSRSDDRESKRTDRAADRNNDADLTAYNDMFAKLAERDAKLAERNSKLEGR